MSTFDEQEVAALFQVVRGTRLELPVVLAVTTGLRRGELLGLRWRDVDLEKGTLAVRQSIEQTKDGMAFRNDVAVSVRTRYIATWRGSAMFLVRFFESRRSPRRDAVGAWLPFPM